MNAYYELANAIVLQAVKDYRMHNNKNELAKLEEFFRSGWFSCLTGLDPELLLAKLKEEKSARHER